MIRGRTRGYRGPDRRAPVAVSSQGGYRGPDRRTRTGSIAGVSRLRLPALLLLVIILLVVLGATSSLRGLSTFVFLRAAADVLLLLAGAGQLLVWRLTGRAGPGLTGAAFVVTGGLMLPLQATGLLLHQDPALQQIAPGCTLVLGVTGAYLCLRSTWSRSVVATLRPARDAAAMTAAALAALTIMGLVRGGSGQPLDGVWPWSVGLGVAAAGWFAAAVGYGRRRDDGARRETRLSLGVAGLAVGDALLAWGVSGHLTVASAAVAVQAVAAAGLLLVSVAALERCLNQQGSRTLGLAGELGDTVGVLAQEQAARQEMLHDARSTLAAIRLANGTLTRYQEQLDEMLQAELRDAVSSELIRLEELLSHEHGRETVVFDLAATLGPVLRVARDGGLHVSAELTGAPPVHGRTADTSAVLHTLLANAAHYAGDGPVTVTARATSMAVQVVVGDRGPGVDPDEREAIFQRGVRGRASEGREGSGLGLFIARWLMDEQGGTLTYEPRPDGGGCFVMTLPLAVAGAADELRGDDCRPGERGLSSVGGPG